MKPEVWQIINRKRRKKGIRKQYRERRIGNRKENNRRHEEHEEKNKKNWKMKK